MLIFNCYQIKNFFFFHFCTFCSVIGFMKIIQFKTGDLGNIVSVTGYLQVSVGKDQ